MSSTTEFIKPDLELRELELKVRELELNVKDLEKPAYKKSSFWTSGITVCIAIIGIVGQSFLSNIKNAQAKLETEQAKKEMREALSKKDNINAEIKRSSDSVDMLRKTQDTIQENLNKIIIAYNTVVNQVAYSGNQTASKSGLNNTTKQVVTETSNNVSEILLTNASDVLLKNSVLKIYYVPAIKDKAITIDKILKSHGVKSDYSLPDYKIGGKNEIVYYSSPQLNYCKAVQALLEDSGLGTFSIRLSSGANATTNHFKIYIVQ